MRTTGSIGLAGLLLAGCPAAQSPDTTGDASADKTVPHVAGPRPGVLEPVARDDLLHPQEKHLRNLRQLTFGGQNAEAYWSFDGDQLVLQARGGDVECDEIYTLDPTTGRMRRVSPEAGRTTCAFWYPGGEHVLFASTHGGSPGCPPEPDYSRGYVWPLYPDYDIYRAEPDGGNVETLIASDRYDAEATMCRDGSIVFTSTRDGDIELYRADADGSNVQRLTHEPGYDGGAFFSQDCSRIVWRASRFSDPQRLTDYQALLEDDLVRPTRLEVFVMDADGSSQRQVTDYDAASFAPYFFPDGQRIIFSSNLNNPRGRNFDLFAVDADGDNLEQITFDPSFESFPMFSPDGKYLAFSSNRGNVEDGETNVFVAEWVP